MVDPQDVPLYAMLFSFVVTGLYYQIVGVPTRELKEKKDETIRD